MRDLICELADYNGKKYIKYNYINSEDSDYDSYTNMEYFVIDVKCEKFTEIMSSTGGFVANMTTRLFEKEHLDVSYLMLVAIPQATNKFLFNFVYLNENKRGVLKSYKDSSRMDYLYFRKKFKSCTVSRGSVYDLDYNFLKEQISDTVSTDFDLIVEGRPITKEDTIIVNDNNVCLNEYEKYSINRRNIKIDHFEFSLDFSGFDILLKGVAITKSGETLKDYEISSRYKDVDTIEDYITRKRAELKEFYGHDVDFEIVPEDYEFRLSFGFAKRISDKLSYKRA